MNKTPIKDLIDSTLYVDYNAPPMYKMKPNMKASFLGSPCLRRIYYEYLRVPKDYGWEIQNIKIFEKGGAYHNLVKRWLRLSGIYIDYLTLKGEIPKHWKTKEPDPEFPVNDLDLNIRRNKIDGVGILQNVSGLKDGLWLYEIKSINQKGFERYLENGPKDDHLQQGMIYSFVFEDNLNAGKYKHVKALDGFTQIQGIIYIYINRENDDENENWKEFHLSKDSQTFSQVIQKIVETKTYIEQKQLPPKTAHFCDGCSYRDKCAQNYQQK